MLKKLSLLFLALGLPAAALSAQEKIKEVVTSNYNRNSISMIALQRGDSYDSQVANAVQMFNPGEKFDINAIRTRTIRVNKVRSESLSQDEVDAAVAKAGLPKEILSYIFKRDAQGMMSDELVRYRGNYDAKDQDVINARASRVGAEIGRAHV